MSTLWKILTRRKILDPAKTEESSLARVLNTFDLTALGVGSTLGVGMYVLVGKVAKETAGPSVILSFLIAAVASAFAGLCYAEFGARTPRAGSAYIYSYVCVGEFIAFVIGWNLILEYIIGSASVARGMSLYIDSLLDNKLKDFFMEIAPIKISFLSPYFDLLSFSIAVVLSIGLAFGMKESSKINNVFTCLNVLVVLFVIIAGSTKADPKNWDLVPPANVTNAGRGGFFPFGISGMIKGAATCFYGFVGFDCIATTGEEVKNPQKAIPFAIVLSLGIVFLAYCGTATVITLMVPYYLQDVRAPIPHAFHEFGWEYAKWIVTIGGIFALCASLFGAMFPLPRILYAMASDGLVFKFLGKVSARFSTPVMGTLLAGLFTGIMSGLFEQGQLVDMMSIGTLLAYTIVAACVLLLRYAADEEYILVRTVSDSSVDTYTDSLDTVNLVNEERDDIQVQQEMAENRVTFRALARQCFNYGRIGEPTKLTEKYVAVSICIYCVLCVLLGLCAIYLVDEISHARIYAILIPSIIGALMIILLMSISAQPNSKKELTFKVPLIPLIPATSILVNIYLMLSLDISTWIRFGVWMIIGLPIYFYSAPKYKSLPVKIYKKSAGCTNFGYVDEDDKQKNSIKSLDSAYFEEFNSADREKTSDSSFKNVDFLLADLDKILEKEDSDSAYKFLTSLDDILGKHVDDERKQSIDTISTMSNVALEQNIIAIVHREDEDVLMEVEVQKESNFEDIPMIEVDEIKSKEIEVARKISDLPFTEVVVPGLPLQANTDELENIASIPPPPPPLPPPMRDFETFKLPRVISMKDTTHKFTKRLKPPAIPPVDYNQQISITPSDEDDSNDDNVAFGSQQYEKIKDKLNKMNMQKVVGMMPPKKLTKPEAQKDVEEEVVMRKKSLDDVMNRIISEIPIRREEEEEVVQPIKVENEVIEEKQETVADIKSKLKDLFKTDKRIVLTSKALRKVSKKKSVLGDDSIFDANASKAIPKTLPVVEVGGNDELDLDIHKKMLKSTLSSIKFKKNERISILDDTVPDISTDK